MHWCGYGNAGPQRSAAVQSLNTVKLWVVRRQRLKQAEATPSELDACKAMEQKFWTQVQNALDIYKQQWQDALGTSKQQVVHLHTNLTQSRQQLAALLGMVAHPEQQCAVKLTLLSKSEGVKEQLKQSLEEVSFLKTEQEKRKQQQASQEAEREGQQQHTDLQQQLTELQHQHRDLQQRHMQLREGQQQHTDLQHHHTKL